MAVEVATAYVSIVPSARGFGRSLSHQLGGQMAAAGAAAGGQASSRFGTAFLGGLSRIGTLGATALAGVGIAAGGWGLKVAAESEQAVIGFETMLGSAEKAQVFLQDLRDFAAKTPFEFPELQKAAGRLTAAGVSADKVIPIMTTLGNVTSGMGTGAEGVDRATYALQQMIASGRILGQDLLQLTNAGIPVFDLLAGATGKSKEQIAQLAQQGKLGKDELVAMMKALETGKGLERFNGLMEKQSQSLKGLFATFKDVLGQGLSTAMGPLIPILKDALKEMSAAIKPMLTVLGPLFSKTIGRMVNALVKMLPYLAPVLEAVLAVGGAMLDVILPLGRTLAPILVEIVDILAGGLIMAFQTIAPTINEFVRALRPLLTVIAQTLATGFVLFIDLLDELLQVLNPVIKIVADQLAQALRDNIPLWIDLVHAFIPLIPQLGRLLTAFAPILAILVTWFPRLLGKMLPYLVPVIEKFTEWVTLMVDDFLPAIERVVGWVVELFDAFIRGDTAKIDEVGRKIQDFLADRVKALLPTFEGVFRTMLTEFQKWWDATAWPWITQKAKEMSDWFWGWVEEQKLILQEKLGTWLREELPGKIAEWAGDVWIGLTNAFIDAMNDIITIWNGLEFTTPEWLGSKDVGPPDKELIPHIGPTEKGGRAAGDLALEGARAPAPFVPGISGTFAPSAPTGGLHINHLEVKGQAQPAATAFAVRSELRWMSMTAGGM